MSIKNGRFEFNHKRSPESIEKQRETMRNQIKRGIRKPPKCEWTSERIKKMVKSNRKANLKSYPIGSRRKHKSSNCIYWVIKIKDRGKWYYEHRYVMEKHIGRKLNTKEHVHHLNGNTLDNRLKNLELINHNKHSSFHSKQRKSGYPKLKYQREKGQWAMKYNSCIICNSISSHHASHGICNKCYLQKRRNS